jgi:short-subunit dehydrogenase
MITNIVITGCSTGIGIETAKYLKERMITVYPTAREQEDVNKLIELGFENALLLDVTKPETIANVIEKVLQKDGKIDVWFNNSGYGQMGAVEDIPTDVLREQFETNVFGLHEATTQVLKVFKKQGYGKLIQHSSVLGLVALPFRGAYNASKYAVEGLTDTLRLEFANTNIYPILLNTGPIKSDFRKNAIESLDKIDTENSDYKQKYQEAKSGNSKKVPFSLEADAVASIVHKIILAQNPAPRYYITKATYILGYAKRVLSTTLLDKLLLKV